MEAKYIVGELPGVVGRILSAIVFPVFMDHKTVARALEIEEIEGAGFCQRNHEGKFQCYGKSDGLKVESRGIEDSSIVNLLGPYEY